MDWVKNNGVLT